jgi:hypothetical protein
VILNHSICELFMCWRVVCFRLSVLFIRRTVETFTVSVRTFFAWRLYEVLWQLPVAMVSPKTWQNYLLTTTGFSESPSSTSSEEYTSPCYKRDSFAFVHRNWTPLHQNMSNS